MHRLWLLWDGPKTFDEWLRRDWIRPLIQHELRLKLNQHRVGADGDLASGLDLANSTDVNCDLEASARIAVYHQCMFHRQSLDPDAAATDDYQPCKEDEPFSALFRLGLTDNGEALPDNLDDDPTHNHSRTTRTAHDNGPQLHDDHDDTTTATRNNHDHSDNARHVD